MSLFKKFFERKVEEVQNRNQSFEQVKAFGSHPYSSRQPAQFHFQLALLERFTPEANKSEILFEAIRSAYEDVVQPKRDSMTDSVKMITDEVYGMLYQAYFYKCARSQSEAGESGGIYATDDAKAVADKFISDFDSGSLSYADLIAKYENTVLNINGDKE